MSIMVSGKARLQLQLSLQMKPFLITVSSYLLQVVTPLTVGANASNWVSLSGGASSALASSFGALINSDH